MRICTLITLIATSVNSKDNLFIYNIGIYNINKNVTTN